MNFRKRLKSYINDINQVHTHQSISFYFLEFVRDVFSDANVGYAHKPDLFPYLEEYIKSDKETVAIKGRADALLGNLIIEFKTDLEEELSDAKDQLRKYIAAIWREEGKVRYLLFASNGIHNKVYRPKLERKEMKPENIELELVDEIDLSSEDPDYTYVWLDRYILYKKLQPPTTENIVHAFGKGTPVYKQALGILRDKWNEVKSESEINVLFKEWKKYLEIVYGESFGEDLFLRHTYLATLSKLMAYTFYSEGALPGQQERLKILSGKAFKEWGIENLFEEDFFVWILRAGEEFCAEFSKELLQALKSFDLRSLEEDVLKGLYQELVDPEERHDLGEYYTPDWLAEYIIKGKEASKSFLDPACGSGTFLASTIQYKRENVEKSGAGLLDHIFSSVVGIDVHPLAVITSRVNYLLATGDLIESRTGKINIPVYFADSIRFPEYRVSNLAGAEAYGFEAEGKVLEIPAKFVKPALINSVMETIKKILELEDSEDLKGKLVRYLPEIELEESELDVLRVLTSRLINLKKQGKDTIWIYILKNIYKPVFLKMKGFDYIIGNPPWLSYNHASNNYQDFLKKQIIEKQELLSGSEAELITHMELATLFFSKTTDLYLNKKGIIEFVMPRGIFTGDQHNKFRKGEFKPKLQIRKIIDLDDVKPLFNINACVVKAEKGSGNTTYPISGEAFRGKLPRKNASLSESNDSLQKVEKEFYLNVAGDRTYISDTKAPPLPGSDYKDEFSQGATLVPRNLWFAEIKKHPKFGINPKEPYVETSEKAIKYAKPDYKDIRMKGNIDRKFLYATLRGSEIVPFAHLPFLPVVLPILKARNKFKIIGKHKLRANGKSGILNWVKTAQDKWEKIRKDKSESHTATEWLNYRNKLTKQDPSKRYKVLYLTSGKDIAATLVDFNEEDLSININGRKIPLNGFIADYKTYYYETNNEMEAYYLTSILNAPHVNQLIKGMQSKGLFGERDICKKVLELPIPEYDPNKQAHKTLSGIGKKGRRKAYEVLSKWTSKYKSIYHIRKGIKEDISEEVQRISELTSKILE